MHVTSISSTEYHDISRRVRAEFREMPGLVLTETQAQRLWRLEPQTCQQVLALLVHEGFLVHTGKGYFRPDGGR